MAQIREFESTTESYFILDGVSYPKVYEAMLDNGYSDTRIKLVGTNRDTTPLVFSTEYTNILVDGEDFDTASEAISRLNQVVFSKGGGSGGGGTDYIPLAGTEVGKPVTNSIQFGNIGAQIYVGDLETIFRYIDIGEPGYGNIQMGEYNIIEDKFIGIHVGLTNQGYSLNIISDPEDQIVNLGIISNIDYSDKTTGYPEQDKFIFVQRSYVDKSNSYSTEEIKTGGTWIDDKDIYTITQLTADTPPTMETVFPTEVIGTYTVYKYTKP